MWILAFILLLSACISQAPKKDAVEFTTSDNKTIKATYRAGTGTPIILLHMLGRDRHDWDAFSQNLNKKGPVLAIDLRGHGQSSGDWEDFTGQDFKDMALDVKAGKQFLKTQGVDVSNFTIIGASIGANTALSYAVTDKDVKTLVLLSPGLEYKGVTTEDTIVQYDGRLLLLASSEDEYSAESCMRLNELAGDATLKVYNNLGHGTQMLSSAPVRDVILTFI